jgi:hypothetical protein
MAKSKNKKRNFPPQSQQKAIPQPTAPITSEDVKSCTSEAEFNGKKENLFEQMESDVADKRKQIESLNSEITICEEKKTHAEQEAGAMREQLAEIKGNIEKLRTEEKYIEDQLKSSNDELENIKEKAEKILIGAEKERIETLQKADKEARDIWRKQYNDLAEQLKEFTAREHALRQEEDRLKDERAKFERQMKNERSGFELEKEDLAEQLAYTARAKEKYGEASPLKLEEEQEKHKLLREKHDDQTKKYAELQNVLDSIRVEISDFGGGKKCVTAGGLVLELKELKEKYDLLTSQREKYPDEESLRTIEKDAERYHKLQPIHEAIERERDRLCEELSAFKRTQKELEIIKLETDATYALNEHLKKELNNHKNALESRTGDTCPELTKVDTEAEDPERVKDINRRKDKNQRAPLTDLGEIVKHVKNYAGNKRLYYSDDDIRAFLAGMAVSRLVILEGMSGTGKSSLPRVFSEAISGFNPLIPVESSWRDRNELLGYYNDFNKKFNAKSFTVELYRHGKKTYSDIPALITLDEMNLARIEYYFSDFLAILEKPNPEDWLIELVPSDMRTLPMELDESVKKKMASEKKDIYTIWEKIKKSHKGISSEATDEEKKTLSDYLESVGKLTGAKDLVDGRKIKVTPNIWFVGTVNRDESTFEISDKVYDRAQIVSLNKKGRPEEYPYPNTGESYISTEKLTKLFENAKNKTDVKKEVKSALDELDKLLVDRFDVSFGNRIVEQTNNFAAVFTMAGGELETALDYQVSTKILRKIITSDDHEAFEILLEMAMDNKYLETQRLIEKRIKDLKR